MDFRLKWLRDNCVASPTVSSVSTCGAILVVDSVRAREFSAASTCGLNRVLYAGGCRRASTIAIELAHRYLRTVDVVCCWTNRERWGFSNEIGMPEDHVIDCWPNANSPVALCYRCRQVERSRNYSKWPERVIAVDDRARSVGYEDYSYRE